LSATVTGPSSLKRAICLGLPRSQITRLSLCIFSVLCVSVLSFAFGTVTRETKETRRSLSGVIVVDQPSTTVILVRHAEKAIVPPENKDPDISLAGLARAQELARMLGESGIKAIYATQFKRTQQTVKPLADKLGLTAVQFEAKNTTELVKQIREKNAGQVVFVAGHNNTVPEIIAALGGPKLPIIPETDFDNFYILTVQSDGTARLLKLKYGSGEPVMGQGMMKQ
jgi:2,3-bisphosphoglycerate-dependent phosphoglycerate mutase